MTGYRSAPKGIATQWVAEMQTHFNEQFQLVLGEDIGTLQRLAPGVDQRNSAWSMFDQVIVSLDSVKPMADNNIIREIARLLDAPIMTTTLPYEEHEDLEYMTDPELIDEKFGDMVDLVIDGGIGGIEPSTVVKCTDNELEIVRQGKGWLEEN